MIDLCVVISLGEIKQVIVNYLLYINMQYILVKCYTRKLNSFNRGSRGKLLSGAL